MELDLLVSVPSRDRPIELSETLDMLCNTAGNLTSVDIQVVVDRDQTDLYDSVMKQYPDIIWDIVEPSHNGWLNIYGAQHEYFIKGNYYFFWFVTDDMSGLTNNWAQAIFDKKSVFPDNLFCLYTRTIAMSRDARQAAICYKDNINVHEHLPIWTRQWGDFLIPLFRQGSKYVVYRELILAALLRLLFIEHSENRNVICDIDYKSVINHGNSAKYGQFWYDLVNNDYNELRPIAKRIKEYIDESRR